VPSATSSLQSFHNALYLPWNFGKIIGIMQISGTLQRGLKVVADSSQNLTSTGAFNEKRLSDLSIFEGAMFPTGHTGLDANESTVDLSETIASSAHALTVSPHSQQADKLTSDHNSKLNFNPLFGEEVEPGQGDDDRAKDDSAGVHRFLKQHGTTLFSTAIGGHGDCIKLGCWGMSRCSNTVTHYPAHFPPENVLQLALVSCWRLVPDNLQQSVN
jgi:hypothetical protein